MRTEEIAMTENEEKSEKWLCIGQLSLIAVGTSYLVDDYYKFHWCMLGCAFVLFCIGFWWFLEKYIFD